MIQAEQLLNGEKMTLAEFTDYVMHMTNFRASVIKFMGKKISENVIGKIYLFIILMYLLLLIVGYVVLCYKFTKKSIVL